MTIQATYHNTGLTPEDVLDVRAHGKLGMFRVKLRSDYTGHIMLYPTQYPSVKIQISRYAANIWSPSFHLLDEIEDLLNEIFGDSSNPEPFGERDILFGPGELRKINKTPLGKLNIFSYFHPEEIAEAVNCYLRYVDQDSWAVTPKTRSDLGTE